MSNLLRMLPLLVLAGLITGCGGGGDEPQPVSGTIKFSGGKMPQFTIGNVNFEPVDGDTTRGAGGAINPDGSYSLRTQEVDGAYPGKYKVYFTMSAGYPPKGSLVAEKFRSAETTPLEAEVPVGGHQNLDFTVDPAE